jgi:hypothetical protein
MIFEKKFLKNSHQKTQKYGFFGSPCIKTSKFKSEYKPPTLSNYDDKTNSIKRRVQHVNGGKSGKRGKESILLAQNFLK